MKQATTEWIAKAEGDFGTLGREARVKTAPNYDAVCFHAQQCAEKYLKACLCESGTHVPRTHDLVRLLEALGASMPALEDLREDLSILTGAGVRFRYPGESADRAIAGKSARRCRKIRLAIRKALGLR
jgi:HEPN domain-containing protein